MFLSAIATAATQTTLVTIVAVITARISVVTDGVAIIMPPPTRDFLPGLVSQIDLIVAFSGIHHGQGC